MTFVLSGRTRLVVNRLASWKTIRNSSSSSFKPDQLHVEVTDGKDTFVCYHPERKFPFEHSRAIEQTEKAQVDSVLRLQYTQSDLRPAKELSDEELMQLTYTSKEFWKPNNEWKKKVNKPKPRRQGL